MRAMMVVLVLLMVCPAGVASRRDQRMIAVIDHSSPAWSASVSRMVEVFAAAMPNKRIDVVYVRREPTCQPAVHPAQIMVCSRPVVNGSTLQNVPAAWNSPIHTIELSDTWITGPDAKRWNPEQIVCHELMHALTGIPDNNRYDPETGITTWAMPDESCVWGTLDTPGPFDMEVLRETFGVSKKRKHR